MAFPALYFRPEKKFTLWSRQLGLCVFDRRRRRCSENNNNNNSDDDDMNEDEGGGFVEYPWGLRRAKARVVGSMLLYKETDEEEKTKYYLVNTRNKPMITNGKKGRKERKEERKMNHTVDHALKQSQLN